MAKGKLTIFLGAAAGVESYMQVHGIDGPWPTGEKILVCISASPFSTQLIRIAKRMPVMGSSP